MRVKYLGFEVTAILFLVAAYYTKYFTDRKLGFVRWLNFNGAKLREQYPTETIKYAALAGVIILTCIALYRFIKKRSVLKMTDIIMEAAMVAATLFYGYATISITNSVTPCSFLLIPLIGAASYLLAIGNLIRGKELQRSI